MIKKLIIPFIASAGGYYYAQKSISINDQKFVQVLTYLNQQNPTYSLYLLKKMMQFKFFKYHKQLSKYILVRDSDREGRYLEYLDELGIGAIQIGPCSLLPSCAEQQTRLLGIGYVEANIHTFRIKQNHLVQNFKIGVNIAPNYQTSKYTPYMIKQNILECFKEVIQLNQISNGEEVNFITLNFNAKYLKQLHNQEYFSMIKQILNQAQRQIDTYNKRKQSQMKLFIQLPKQIAKHFAKIPQQKIISVDQNNQFQRGIDQKFLELGKERINWNQLVKKIIDKTLI